MPFLCACKQEFTGLRACVTDTAKPAPSWAGWAVSAVILSRMLTGEKHTPGVKTTIEKQPTEKFITCGFSANVPGLYMLFSILSAVKPDM